MRVFAGGISKVLRAGVFSLIAVVATGCGGDNDDEAAAPDGQNGTTTSVALNPNQTQELILPDIAKVTITPGAIPDPGANGQATLAKTTSEDVQQLWDDTAVMHRAAGKAAFEATITLPTQPSSDIQVELTVPQEVKASMTSQDELRVFYVNRYVEDLGKGGNTNSVEPLELRGAASASVLTVSLPNYAFQDDGTGKWVANVFVGKTQTAALSTPTVAMSFKGWWQDTHIISQAIAQAAPAAQCEGSSLVRPVGEEFPISSPFGPRNLTLKNASKNHKGIDFDVEPGTEVVAAAKGRIEVAKSQVTKQGAVTGYGYYIVLRHEDGGSTLYGHLQSDSAAFPVGTEVEAGTVIAKSGNTGTSTGPHLHFEYAPNGAVHVSATKVNPVPCLGSNVKGDLTVADNGNAADDSFAVSFNGREICRTEIGQPNNCTLNNLRPGTYILTVAALVVPDNAGTYSITSQSAKLLIDGASATSNVIPSGATGAHNLTVLP